MKTALSPYNRPWTWLTREAVLILLFALAAWAVLVLAPGSLSQLLVFTALAAIVLALTARTAADILVAGFCQWCKAMGGGLGCLVGSLQRRKPRR